MRRLAPSVNSSRLLLRFVASASVLQNVPPAKTSVKLGTPVAKEELAKAFNVPAALLEQACRPAEILFTTVDLARSRFAPLIATLSAEEDVTRIAAEVRAAKGGNNTNNTKNTPVKAVAGAKEKFKNTAWTSVRELVTFYEEAMYPMRVKLQEYKVHELNSFHIKDDLKRGLSAFKQDHLDKQKTELVKVQKHMQDCQNFIKEAAQSSFDTSILNDIANILRICGERNPHAHRMSLQVLDDMSVFAIPFDAVTVKLLHASVFNDGAVDDSALLFTLLEYPERGEVSVGTAPVEEIADATLRVISKRHHTPLDSNSTGRLLRQTDTHPCLQRSAE